MARELQVSLGSQGLIGGVELGVSASAQLAKCRVCGEVKAQSDFYPSKTHKTGHASRCKRCDLAASKARWDATPDKVRESNQKWYQANAEKARSDAKERRKALSESNPEYRKERYWKDPATARERSRKWAEANPKKVAASKSAWQDANRAKVYASTRRWALANPDKVAAYRRARQAGPASVAWVSQDDITDFYGRARRLTEVTGVKQHVDHVFPLAGKTVCGLHVPTNLRVIGAMPNRMKGNKLPGDLQEQLWDPHGPDVFHE